MSHVELNFIYRLKMIASGRLKPRGPLRRIIEVVIRAPNGFDRILDKAMVRIFDGVKAIPELTEAAERGIATTVFGKPQVEGTPEGLVQRIARHSSSAESLAALCALGVSTFLQKLQRSTEKSLLTSALLAGVITTVAFLFAALWPR